MGSNSGKMKEESVVRRNGMRVEKLMKNIIDQVKEGQLKLGYVRETVRLYYPLESMNAILETNFTTARDLVKSLNPVLLRECALPGGVWLGFQGERIDVSVSPKAVEYIYKTVPASGFLVDMIELFRNNPHCTLEEICRVFERHSKAYVCEKMPENTDFDYVLHFDNEEIDEFYYCIKMEMGHTTYHRFNKGDYEALIG